VVGAVAAGVVGVVALTAAMAVEVEDAGVAMVEGEVEETVVDAGAQILIINF